MVDISREPNPNELTGIDTMTGSRATWLSTTSLSPVRNRLQKTSQIETLARRKERKAGKFNDLHCGACFSLEYGTPKESELDAYDVMKLHDIKPLFSLNKFTGQRTLNGFSLNYCCSERGHGLCRQVSTTEIDRLAETCKDKNILAKIAEAKSIAEEELR